MKLKNKDRRIFIFDTEADITTKEHYLTHISIAQIEINYEADDYDIVRWFTYDYNDR